MPLDQCTLERLACAAEQRQREAQELAQAISRSSVTVSSRLAEIVHNRDFRLLWVGEGVSLLGDQFFLVALPWLVLQLTGDAFAIGTVIAVAAAPRAIFMLLGGALTDRFSPRAVMLYSNVGRTVLVGILALLTATGSVELWMLYVFGLLLGFGYALYLPAQSSMIPRLLPRSGLQTGNAIIQGTAQFSLFIGPVVAGGLIALLGRKGFGGTNVSDASGITIAFAFDAATFLLSAITLGLIRLPAARLVHKRANGDPGVLASLAAGLADVWRDRTLRHYFILIAAVNLCLLGPLSVGIPVLADIRFSSGALAFGTILSALGAGAFIGVVAAGTLRRPPGRSFAAAMLASSAMLGVGLALLGAFSSWGAAAGAAFLIGLAEGYLIVEFITWLQLRTSRDELGRMMGILFFVSVGQAPVSNIVAGALIGLDASLVMVGAGLLIVLVSLIAALSPSVWQLGNEEGLEMDDSRDAS